MKVLFSSLCLLCIIINKSAFLVDKPPVHRRGMDGLSTRNGRFVYEENSDDICVLIINLLHLLFSVCYNYLMLRAYLFVCSDLFVFKYLHLFIVLLCFY